MILTCTNCSNDFAGKYCNNCAQPAQLKRIDGHYILHEIEHILHFDKGILYTIKALLIRPGKSIKRFISDDRSRLVKPVIFIIITSLIYTTINHFFHIEDGYISVHEVKSKAITSIFGWIQSHYGYANIIMGVFIAAWLKLFFRKYDYNFFEILILLCFVIGVAMLILALFALIQGVTKIGLMQYSGMLSFGYISWAIGQFFDQRKISSYVKALFAYVLGMLTSTITALLIGYLIDTIFT